MKPIRDLLLAAAVAGTMPTTPIAVVAQDTTVTQALPTANSATTETVIRASTDPRAGGIVPRELFGVNALFFHEKDAVRDHPVYRASLTAIAPTVMRYPAGTAGDNYLWKTNSIYRTDWYPRRSDPTADADTTEFLKLASDFNAMPLMVINYRSFAAANDMEACYRNAEDWVRFVNDGQHTRVRYWEFGNEVYFKDLSVDPEHYATSYNIMRRRLKKIDPELKLGLVMAHFWIGGPALVERYNERVTAKLDSPPDFMILHFYPVVNSDNFLREGMGMRAKIGYFRRGLREHGLDPNLPIFVTEWNASSRSETLQGQTIGHVMCVAQGLLELDDAGVQCATFWPLHGTKGLLETGSHALHSAGRMMAGMRELMSGSRRVGIRLEPDVGEIEAAAFRAAGGNTIAVVLLNRDSGKEYRMQLNLEGVDNDANTTLTTLHAATTEEGKKADLNAREIKTSSRRLKISGNTAEFRLPVMSVSFLEVSGKFD